MLNIRLSKANNLILVNCKFTMEKSGLAVDAFFQFYKYFIQT